MSGEQLKYEETKRKEHANNSQVRTPVDIYEDSWDCAADLGGHDLLLSPLKEHVCIVLAFCMLNHKDQSIKLLNFSPWFSTDIKESSKSEFYASLSCESAVASTMTSE